MTKLTYKVNLAHGMPLPVMVEGSAYKTIEVLDTHKVLTIETVINADCPTTEVGMALCKELIKDLLVLPLAYDIQLEDYNG